MQLRRKIEHGSDERARPRSALKAVPLRCAYVDPAEEAMSRNPLLSPPLHFKRDGSLRWRTSQAC